MISPSLWGFILLLPPASKCLPSRLIGVQIPHRFEMYVCFSVLNRQLIHTACHQFLTLRESSHELSAGAVCFHVHFSIKSTRRNRGRIIWIKTFLSYLLCWFLRLVCIPYFCLRFNWKPCFEVFTHSWEQRSFMVYNGYVDPNVVLIIVLGMCTPPNLFIFFEYIICYVNVGKNQRATSPLLCLRANFYVWFSFACTRYTTDWKWFGNLLSKAPLS